MRKFIKKVIIFTGIAAGVIFGFLYYYHASQIETLDAFYRRFTVGKRPSLLLGSSRTAQGLRPEIFDRELNDQFSVPFFNYSFTVGSSNIGPNYLKKIKKKLKPAKNSLFILCVDPWIMKQPIGQNNSEFDEENTFFAHQQTQTMSPNIEYLLFRDKKEKPFFQKIFFPDSSIYHLHENGWLQVNFENKSKGAIDNSNWQIHLYTQDTLKFELAEKRFIALEKMVRYLDAVGTIFLVRLPTSEAMMNLENQAFPRFDQRIEEIAQHNKIQYINLISESGTFQTVDGNHIYKDDTERLSKHICDLIKNLK